ncbi:MAG: glycosyltransferase family 4 protein [Pseudomonadota bacterium]|jgi:glycosyltransferase involved in cell wall biosynthesis
MFNDPKIVTSIEYKEPNQRQQPAVINTHMFQNSFPALPGGVNGVGGSATVQAMQALGLGDRGIMVAPTDQVGRTLQANGLPAVGYSFVGNSDTHHDTWYEEGNRAFLVERVMGQITGRNDVVYAHMPISGQVGMEHCRSNGNPLVYLGHAWEILSSTFFPDREIKPLRLITEYAIIDYLLSNPGRGFIVTNSDWEADAIAKAYSRSPSPNNVGQFVHDITGESNIHENLFEPLKRAASDLEQKRIRFFDEERIRGLCIKNPIGVDTSEYSPDVLTLRRMAVRDVLLDNLNIPRNATVIGGVGRIHPQKDPLTSLAVFEKVRDGLERPDDVYLLLAGPGDRDSLGEATGYYAQVLAQLRNRYADMAPNVRIPGAKVDAKDINSVLDVRLCTARFETWGLSFQESLCMGVPSVALTNPVYQELYGGTGVTLESDHQKLAESIVALVQDPTRRNEYGSHCRHIGARYDWDNSVTSLLGLLQREAGFK